MLCFCQISEANEQDASKFVVVEGLQGWAYHGGARNWCREIGDIMIEALLHDRDIGFYSLATQRFCTFTVISDFHRDSFICKSLWKYDTVVKVQKRGVAREPNPWRHEHEAAPLPLSRPVPDTSSFLRRDKLNIADPQL